jgi:hypothetical protein
MRSATFDPTRLAAIRRLILQRARPVKVRQKRRAEPEFVG